MAEKYFFIKLTAEDRIRVLIKTDKGEVEKFTVQYEIFRKEKWQPVVRYDTAHGYAHRDLFTKEGKIDKMRLKMDSFAKSLNWSLEDLKNKWEYYRSQYE